MSHQTDPVITHSLREALIIGLVWLASTVYSCTYTYLYGYIRPGRALTAADIQPIFGVPSWVFWGILAPWAVCALFTFWFAGFYMIDDDLGSDHTAELENDIRAGGRHE